MSILLNSYFWNLPFIIPNYLKEEQKRKIKRRRQTKEKNSACAGPQKLEVRTGSFARAHGTKIGATLRNLVHDKKKNDVSRFWLGVGKHAQV